MEIIHLLVLFIAGVAVAFINTISAAGSLVTLPAFMFCGLSVMEANAANRIPIIVQSYFSTKGFESKGITGDSYKWWLALACMPGAVAGALYAINIPSHIFNKILAGIMLLFLIITIVNPVTNKGEQAEKTGFKYKAAGFVSYFFIGFYGGFIQAGSGFFLMLPLMFINGFDLVKTNYYKVFVTIFFSIAALLIFMYHAPVNWLYGLVAAAGSAVGGWLTSRWSVTVNEVLMKRIMVSLIFVLTIYVWLFK